MADKRKPVIDDSPEPNQHSLDDDFNDLIRRELSDDAPKSAPAPVIEPKAVQPVKIEPVKKEIKIEPVKKVERPVPVKKVDVKPAEPKKVEAKPQPKVVAVKPQPKKIETKPEPRKVERAKVEPKKVEPRKVAAEPVRGAPAYDDEPKGLGKWVAILLVLILAAAAVYAVGALRSGKDASGLDCATEYADARGTTLSWSDASAVEQFWLTKAFETKSEAESVEILHMLACESAFISTLSEPAGYSSCPTPDVFVVVDENALSENPIARLDKDSVLSKLNAESAMVRFMLAYKLTDPNIRAWKIVEPTKK